MKELVFIIENYGLDAVGYAVFIFILLKSEIQITIKPKINMSTQE